MPTIQIKHVSERTHAELRRRAEASHQSLQQYLLQLLDEQAGRPSLDDWLDDLPMAESEPVDLSELTEAIRLDRAGH